MNDGAGRRVLAEQVKSIQRLERGFRHANRTCIDFRLAVVDLVAALPDTKIRCAIGTSDVVHQILDEINFVESADNTQTGRGHLGKHQQINGGCVYLQVAPSIVCHHLKACGGVVFGVQRMFFIQRLLECFNLRRLAHHAHEQAAHQFDGCLFQLIAALGIAKSFIGDAEHPSAEDGVHIVAHPGVGVVAMGVDTRTRWQQPGYRVLAAENDGFDFLKNTVENVFLFHTEDFTRKRNTADRHEQARLSIAIRSRHQTPALENRCKN